jgi:alpha-tubulin suppressor-like RCC1 family protein
MKTIPALALTVAMLGSLAGCSETATNPDTPPAAVATLQVTAPTTTLAPGQQTQLTVTVRDAEGDVLTGRVVQYTSSATAVVTVSGTGRVTGVAVGNAKVTVTSEGKAADINLSVVTAPVAMVQVVPATVTLDPAGTASLAATVRDAANNVLADREVGWVSSAPGIATVDANGKVTALTGGEATITAASGGKSAVATVTVRAVSPVAVIEIQGALDTLEAYDVRNLQAVLRDAQGTPIGGLVAWSSSNPAVATVHPTTGVITGVDRGTVTITATSNGKTHSVSRVVVIKYRSITAATMHACDLASGGIAWCWGLNGTDARLGSEQVGDNVHRTEPFRVPGGHRFSQIDSYGRTTCAIDLAGKAWCWGNNGWGALGAGSGVPFSAMPLAVAGNHTFVQLEVGIDHACGLTATGTAHCWGHNDWGQFGIGNTTSSSAPVVAAGGAQFLRVAAGSNFTCGIALAGGAFCWGANSIGQLGDGGAISYGNVYKHTPSAVVGGHTFTALSLGNQYACGLATNGAAYCWGNNNGNLGDGSVTETSAPRAVAGGLLFSVLSAGYGHACGVTNQDQVYCWGANGYGQLGAGAQNGTTAPVLALDGSKAAEVSAAGIGTGSGGHTCAIAKDRLTTWCWGRNDTGQLGNGATAPPATFNTIATIVLGQKPL